jgi:hypothetical protein
MVFTITKSITKNVARTTRHDTAIVNSVGDVANVSRYPLMIIVVVVVVNVVVAAIWKRLKIFFFEFFFL